MVLESLIARQPGMSVLLLVTGDEAAPIIPRRHGLFALSGAQVDLSDWTARAENSDSATATGVSAPKDQSRSKMRTYVKATAVVGAQMLAAETWLLPSPFQTKLELASTYPIPASHLSPRLAENKQNHSTSCFVKLCLRSFRDRRGRHFSRR